MTLTRGPVPLGGTRAAPPWLVVASGAAIALATSEVALTIGMADALSLSASTVRLTALFIGALLGRSRWSWVLWAALLVTSVSFALIAYTPLIERPALSLLRADAEGPPADAVAVYSAAMTDAGHIADVALTRLVSGIDDARRLGIPALAVSVQARTVRGRVVSTEADQSRLVEVLGAGLVLHTVTNVTNTHDESLAFAALARARGWQRVRVVTSPLHARRACETLEATGVLVTCAPATSRDVAITQLGTSGARLVLWRAAVHEVVGLLVYRWRGWR